MKIKKGDQVLIIKGKDRGKKGKVLRGFPKEDQVLIEGINIKKRHRKPKKEGEKGQVVEVPKPMPISKLKLICPKCGKPTRVGYGKKSTDKTQKHAPYRKQVSGSGSKIRVCKKCGGEI